MPASLSAIAKDILIFFAILISVPNIAKSYEKFTLKNNDIAYGIVQNEDSSAVSIKTFENSIIRLEKNQISKRSFAYVKIKSLLQEIQGMPVKIEPDRIVIFENGKEREIQRELISSYSNIDNVDSTAPSYQGKDLFAFTLGTPAILNFMAQVNVNKIFGIRFIGAWWYELAGLEFNALLNIPISDKITFDLYAGGGYFSGSNSNDYIDWKYTTIGLDMIYKKVIAGAGVSFGKGYLTNPFPMFKIGYIFSGSNQVEWNKGNN